MKREKDAMGRRLKEEGTRVVGDFSAELHARVMVEVRRQQEGRDGAARGGWVWWGMGLAAASAVVAVGVWMTRGPMGEVTMDPQQVAVVLPALPSLEDVVREAGPVRERMEDARFAYLDRDAKRLASFLRRSVPGVGSGNPNDETRMTN